MRTQQRPADTFANLERMIETLRKHHTPPLNLLLSTTLLSFVPHHPVGRPRAHGLFILELCKRPRKKASLPRLTELQTHNLLSLPPARRQNGAENLVVALSYSCL